jgi:hypothetical protein
MSSQNRLSTLVEWQLPDFIRRDHPLFVEFLQKYYEYLETPNSPVYELKRFSDNYDVDKAREAFLQYFKNKIIPSFPDSTELSTERIIKAARDFYAKKGTPDSFKFLFSALYGAELEVFFPKLQILKASDGKWILPQAFRLTLTGANLSLDLNLIEKRKAYGSISRASCIVESAIRTIDKSTNNEIVEIYVSNVNRAFQNGEDLEIEYLDINGATQTFSEKIIGALSNIQITQNRRGTRYLTGDPVVINGGLDTTSTTKVKAVATVGNVTTGSIDSVTVLNRGYGFRTFPNSLVDIVTANGVGANVIVASVDTANNIEIPYNIDAILYKKDTLLNAADYDFDNVASADINTTIIDALTFEKINVYPILTMSVVNGGSFFSEEPTLDVVSLFESDYSETNGNLLLSPGSFSTYNASNSSIKFVGGGFSSVNDYYNGWRILLEKQYRTIIDYDGATKTAFLDRSFEVNINLTNILTKNLYLDSRPSTKSMGYIAHVEVLNGGSGYDSGDTLSLAGTGYGAVLSPTITGGSFTAVSVSNRGEGYVEPPTVIVNTSTGSGALFKVYVLGNGEEFDVVTGDIGQVRDIILSNRGSDYVSAPNVSLKVYDILISPLGGSEVILENDIVYQGVNVNTTTFRAIVDEYYPSNNIIRVFNYSGSINVAQNLVVYKTETAAQTNTFIQTSTIGGKTYPYKYGDGRARATAEFLNGLIRYNGYYLNTDGQLSSDKRLQDAKRYHNYSYELISDRSYTEYSKTVLESLHPAGASLLAAHMIKTDLQVSQLSNINVHTLYTNSNSLITNCNVGFNAAIVSGNTGSDFDLLANIGDIIIINSGNVYRSFAKVITSFTSNTQLNIESPCVIVGEGRGKVTANLNTLTISGNSNSIVQFITVDDELRINVNNSILVKTINSISGNVITLNSNVGITTTNTNLVYFVYPKLNAVSYKIVSTTDEFS